MMNLECYIMSVIQLQLRTSIQERVVKKLAFCLCNKSETALNSKELKNSFGIYCISYKLGLNLRGFN